MQPEALEQHLSQIATTWTDLFQAHAGEADAAHAAQRQLLERYSGAVYRYLLGAVRDTEAADDLFQEFGLRLVRGDFKGVHPEKGRFRNFLKTCLYHLIVDHQRRRQRQAVPLGPDLPEPACHAEPPAESDQQFQAAWQVELMKRAWEGLARHDRDTGQHLHTVLRFRTDHPDLRSADMAERLAATVGKPLTSDWVRKRLFLAREKFTDLLLAEVARSLGNPGEDEVEEELALLGLLEYCRPALERRHSAARARGAAE
jgi:RNA polymerase sigma-70 factor (ECF subfamily)